MTPTRILFIGNSFTNRNDLPGMLERLAAAAEPPHRVETDRVIANGRALKTHWERGEAREVICERKWDYVVLQEQSTLPLKNPLRMKEYVNLFDEEIRTSGARTVLYMTWARRHQWERQPELAEVYLGIGRAIGEFFASLFDQGPQGLQTSDLKQLARFRPDAATVLQQVAWQTIGTPT